MKRLFDLIILFIIISQHGYCQTSRDYYNNGSEKILKGNYQEAILDLSKAISIDPNFVAAYENRGYAKVKLQDFRGAIVDYNRAIEIVLKNPPPYAYNTFYDLYKNRALSKYSIRDYKGAISDYTKCLEYNSSGEECYLYRGMAKYHVQDYKGAIADFNLILETPFINSYRFYRSEAYYRRGIVKIELGQKEDGCLDLSKAGEMGYSEAYESIKKYCQ